MYLSNPESTFQKLDRAVLATRSEQAAVNEILRTLAALGMARALVQTPEVHESRYDGSILRIYVWRDTPYQDDLVLAAGPQFTSKIALGKSIPVSNEVGLFIRGILMDRRARTLADAEKQLEKAERRAQREAEKAAKAAQPPKPRGRPRKTEEEKRAAAYAKRSAAAAARDAAKAVEKAKEAAAELKEKKRRGRPKKEIQAAEVKAQEAVAEAQEAAVVAQEAAAEAIEVVAETTASAPAVDMAAAEREMDILLAKIERKIRGGA